MRGLTVVIPSKLTSNLVPCVTAVREMEPGVNIVVVDDGLQFDDDNCAERFFRENVTAIPGLKPFGFPRNVNLGITAAPADDIVVLNDDALLKTQGGFTLLQREAEKYPEVGILSATTNVAGNPDQKPSGVGLRATPSSVAFVCVLLPRRTLNVIGLMDERFGGLTPDGRRIYGWCDNDMCRRIKAAGLKIGIHDGCYVDHASLRSSFRGDPGASADTSAGARLYMQKWGDLL